MIRSADDPLEKARRLHSRGRWRALTLLLEPLVPLYRESAEFYWLLGSSSLRLDEDIAAITYLDRARQLMPENGEVALYLIAAHAARGESGVAAGLCLEILERNPGDSVALRAMEIIRSGPATAGRSAFEGKGASAMLLDLLPARGFASDRGFRGIVPIILILVLIAIAAALFLLPKDSLRIEPANSSRPSGSGSALVSGPSPAEIGAAMREHENAIVRWRGYVSNASTAGSGGHFLLVVGSVDLRTVEALVPVDCSAKLPAAGSFVEVEGRIILEGSGYALEARSIIPIVEGSR
jgi:hypothetical protein